MRLLGGVLVLLSLLASLACNPFANQASSPDLVVVAPYFGQDADHFDTVLKGFERQTGLHVDLIGAASLGVVLDRALSDGVSIDVALLAQPGLIRELARTDAIEPLPDSVVNTVHANYEDRAAAIGQVDGTPYGVWFRADIKSLIWYSPAVFQSNGWQMPQSLDELDELVSQIKATGLAPWCMTLGAFGASGWPATDWVEDLVLRLAGPQQYDEWVNGDLAFSSEPVRTAFQRFQTLLAPQNVYGGKTRALGASFEQAPLDLTSGKCAMLHFGTSVLNLLPSGVSVGPNGAIDAFPLPGAEGQTPPLLVSGEIAVGFNQRAETAALLNYLASPESAVSWAKAGGYLPPYSTFPADTITSEAAKNLSALVARAETIRFDGSDLMPQQIGTRKFWTAMLDVVGGQNLDSVLCSLDAAWADYRTQLGLPLVSATGASSTCPSGSSP
jgi:alpha-glucoside transport system substrate-binding protein